jgi:glutathione S-transferase
MSLTLVIGNKNYSSWSLRPWLYMRHFDIAFEEVRIPLYRPDSHEQIQRYSPSGKVPVLIEGENIVWDSLAILEFMAEHIPYARGWPERIAARAFARSVCAEMHSGFAALRSECGMNCRREPRPKTLSPDAHRDIARIRQIWQQCRAHFGSGGPWLMGEFSIVDAMYAPVVLRFHQYALEAGPVEHAYIATMLAHPALQEWVKAGQAETETIEMLDD